MIHHALNVYFKAKLRLFYDRLKNRPVDVVIAAFLSVPEVLDLIPNLVKSDNCFVHIVQFELFQTVHELSALKSIFDVIIIVTSKN